MAKTPHRVTSREPASYREKDAKVFTRERVPITLELGGGDARAVILASDLGHDYVSINADYRSWLMKTEMRAGAISSSGRT